MPRSFSERKAKNRRVKTFIYREKAESLKYHSPGHRPGSIDSPNQIAGYRPATGIIAS
jgi:hypothetical protein